MLQEHHGLLNDLETSEHFQAGKLAFGLQWCQLNDEASQSSSPEGFFHFAGRLASDAVKAAGPSPRMPLRGGSLAGCPSKL